MKNNLKYPIGTYEIPTPITTNHITEWIAILAEMPEKLATMVDSLSEEQLDTPYRPGGWSVRQLIHHIADSHHHSYIRFKWALTEENPVIKPYDQDGWSDLFDAHSAPIHLSINHLAAVHARLVYLLQGLTPEQLEKTFIHPEGNTTTTLAENVGRYAWHGSHHLKQIENLIEREGW